MPERTEAASLAGGCVIGRGVARGGRAPVGRDSPASSMTVAAPAAGHLRSARTPRSVILSRISGESAASDRSCHGGRAYKPMEVTAVMEQTYNYDLAVEMGVKKRLKEKMTLVVWCLIWTIFIDNSQ